MSKQELKPCPFCGGKAEIVKSVNDGGAEKFDMFEVQCAENKSRQCHWLKSLAKEEAIGAWNTRPIEDALRAENETLKQKIKELTNER